MSEAIAEKKEDAGGGSCLGVTVRTPAGASSAFAIRPQDTAGELIDLSVAYFVGHNMPEDGTFKLGLVREGEIIDLDRDDKLGRAGVIEGDVLHLLTCEDQVDGSH